MATTPSELEFDGHELVQCICIEDERGTLLRLTYTQDALTGIQIADSHDELEESPMFIYEPGVGREIGDAVAGEGWVPFPAT